MAGSFLEESRLVTMEWFARAVAVELEKEKDEGKEREEAGKCLGLHCNIIHEASK